MYQSLDGVLLRIIRAKSLEQVKEYTPQLVELLNNFKEAKRAYAKHDHKLVGAFFTYYLTKEDTTPKSEAGDE